MFCFGEVGGGGLFGFYGFIPTNKGVSKIRLSEKLPTKSATVFINIFCGNILYRCYNKFAIELFYSIY